MPSTFLCRSRAARAAASGLAALLLAGFGASVEVAAQDGHGHDDHTGHAHAAPAAAPARAPQDAHAPADASAAPGEGKLRGVPSSRPVPTWEGGPLSADTVLYELPSGLRYTVLEPGEGEPPGSRFDQVQVHYSGWLTDGTPFDSSHSHGGPAMFPLSGVIPGWTEGLQLMPVGARYVFVLPPELAYGERAQGKIPPNATLVFEVELLEVTKRVELPEFTVPDAAQCQSSGSGLLEQVLAEGEGEPARPNDWVTLHYTLWKADGVPLDSTAVVGAPQQRPVNAMPLPGLSEGVQRMRAGGKSRFVLPAELAFGEQGVPGLVEPGTDVICEVELVAIERGPEPLPQPEFSMPAPENCRTTGSGLQFEVLAVGEGDVAVTNDRVNMHYTLWLPDGTLVFSTTSRGEPQLRPVKQMPMAGLSEGVQTMRAGGKSRFIVPPELAFGAQGIPGQVPPDSRLVCEVQVLSIERGASPLPVPTFRMPSDEELTTTASGLRYQMLKEGLGAAPRASDTVTAHYAGWLADGTLFDSSFEGGAPADFSLGGVIAGWTEGLQLMREGGEAIFVIPSNLAYGPGGRPPVIPPAATLVFLVHLHRVGG